MWHTIYNLIKLSQIINHFLKVRIPYIGVLEVKKVGLGVAIF